MVNASSKSSPAIIKSKQMQLFSHFVALKVDLFFKKFEEDV